MVFPCVILQNYGLYFGFVAVLVLIVLYGLVIDFVFAGTAMGKVWLLGRRFSRCCVQDLHSG